MPKFSERRSIKDRYSLLTGVCMVVFVIFSILMGGYFIKNISPLRLPDPDMHLYNTIALAQGNFITKAQDIITAPSKWIIHNQAQIFENNVLCRIVPSTVSHGGDGWMAQIGDMDKNQGGASVEIRNQYASIVWAPQALALSIANSLELSMKDSYILMRSANLFFYVVLLSICIAIIPRGKVAATVLALNPYSIFMASSISSDTYTIALVSLFLAFIFKLCLERERSIERWEKAMLIILSVLLFMGKVPYVTVILLIFVLPKEMFSLRKKLVYFFVGSFVGGIIYIIWSKLFLHVMHAPWVDQSANMSLILHSPFKAVKLIIADTIWPNKYDLALCGDSIASMIHQNDWLVLPTAVVFVSGVGFMIHTRLKSREKFNLSLLLGTLFVAFAAIALTKAFLLLTWTDVREGFSVIHGFQGRYYLPLIFVLLLPFIAYESKRLKRTLE